MEPVNQEKIVGRLCATGKAKYTTMISGAGYKFIEDHGFQWDLDPIDIDQYGIHMDALLDCVEQLEKMGPLENVPLDKEQQIPNEFRDGQGWLNSGLVIQSKADPRIVCSVKLVSKKDVDYDCTMEWFVDLGKESKTAIGAAERGVDPEELKAVERAQEMSKEKAPKKESLDSLFNNPMAGIFSRKAPKKISVMRESIDGWGLPMGEESMDYVGADSIVKPGAKEGDKDRGETAGGSVDVKPKVIDGDKTGEHMEGSGGQVGGADKESALPAAKIKPGKVDSEPKEMGENKTKVVESKRKPIHHDIAARLAKKDGAGKEVGKEADPERVEEGKIKVVKGDDKNKSAVGIHLTKPSKEEIESAKEDAANKGHHTIYVHSEQPKFGKKSESRHYIGNGKVMLQVEDSQVYVGTDSLVKAGAKEGDKDRGEVDGKGVDVKPEIEKGEPGKVMQGTGGGVGVIDKETGVPASVVKPGKPDATPKLMAERKKLREAAIKRREEARIAKGAPVQEGKKKALGESYDHPHKVMDGLKRHMDEAHRSVRKGHEMVEWAQKHMNEAQNKLPHPLAGEMAKHHSTIEDAKNKIHESKRMMSEMCEDIDRLHRQNKRK